MDERCAVDLDCTDDVIISDLLGAVDDHLRANAGRLNRVCELLQAPFQSVCSGARIMHTEQFVSIQVCSMHTPRVFKPPHPRHTAQSVLTIISWQQSHHASTKAVPACSALQQVMGRIDVV